MKTQYCNCHFGKHLDEIEQIIKDNFSEYYTSTIKSFNNNFLNCCNIFIMKKYDFIKYGDFVFGVLLEFDRRHNLKTDVDIKNFITLEAKKSGKRTNIDYQCRLEGFLMERILISFMNITLERNMR